jgi:hypothetical protein
MSIDCACNDCDSSQACGQPWSGNLETYTYNAGTSCAGGKAPTTTTTTQVVKKMDDNRSSCVQQTGTQSGQQYWAKWSCSDVTGGTVTSTRCRDSECRDCDTTGTLYTVSVLGNYQGACLTDNVAGVSYMMTPPTNDPKYETAICPCMRDVAIPTPAPVPPAPTPSPALTCKDCVTADNMQW